MIDPGQGDVYGQNPLAPSGPFDATLGLGASPAQLAGFVPPSLAVSNLMPASPGAVGPLVGWVGFGLVVSGLAYVHPLLGAAAFVLGAGALVPSLEGQGFWNALGVIGMAPALGPPGALAGAAENALGPRPAAVPSVTMGMGGGPPAGRAVVGGLRGVPTAPPIRPGDIVINPHLPKAQALPGDITGPIQSVPSTHPHLLGTLPEVYFEHVPLMSRGLDESALNAAKQLLQPGGQVRVLTNPGPQFDQALRDVVQSAGGVIRSATETVTSGGNAAVEYIVTF